MSTWYRKPYIHDFKLNFPIYPVGIDADWRQNELKDSSVPKDIQFIVYWYHNEGYSGTGIAAAFRGSKIDWWNCGHCSCSFSANDGYNKWWGESATIEDFLTFDKIDPEMNGRIRNKEDSDYVHWKKVVKRMKQLLKKRNII